jgi:hypothetical protein
MIKFIRLIFALFVCFGASGYDCLLYGQVLENYDPHIAVSQNGKFFERADRLDVTIDLVKFPQADLRISMPADAALFFDGELWGVSPRDTVMYIDMKDLITHFSHGNNQLELSVFKKRIRKNEVSVSKGIFAEAGRKNATGETEDQSRREKDMMKEFFFLAILLILFLVALLRTVYPSVFAVLLRSRSVFSAEDFWESAGLTKIYSSELLFFIILVNMAVSLLLMVFFSILEIPVFGVYIAAELNYLFLVWLSASVLLTILAFLKFVWIKINTFIFSLWKFELPHFFFLLRVKGLGMASVIFLLIALYANDMMRDQTYLIYVLLGFLIFYLIGILVLLTWMTKKIEFKIYHLFSYLCTAELIPFLAICKWVLG